MDTIKTAIVLVFLLAILYGAYVVLNKPLPEAPVEVGWSDEQLQPPEIDFSSPTALPPVDVPDMGPTGNSLTAPPPPFDAAPARGPHAASSATPPTGFNDPPPLLGAPPTATAPESGGNSDAFGVGPDTQGFPARPAAYGPPDAAPENSISNSQLRPIPQDALAPPPGDFHSDPQPQGGNFYSEQAHRMQQQAGGASTPPAAFGGGEQLSPTVPARDLSGQPRAALPTTQPQPTQPTPGASAETPSAPAGEGFELAMQRAVALVRQGQPKTALAELSPWSRRELTAQQREQLFGFLDPLAGRVIYSRAHLLVSPHIVREGETLFQIAERFRVPWQLLQNINGLQNPNAVPEQLELKIVPGPFRGEIDLSNQELTLYVDELYAGRFPLQLGDDPAPAVGSYAVRGKEKGHMYFTADGSEVPFGDPRNPYGSAWIDLGQGIILHGAVEGAVSRGCLGLPPRDASDVLGILSVESEVEIRP